MAALIRPPDIFAAGVFGGYYFERYHFPSEYPYEWGYNAKRCPRYDWRSNKYRIDTRRAGRPFVGSRSVDDPRGFLQWWMRYYMGRRIAAVDEIRFAELEHYTRTFLMVLDKSKSHVRRKHVLQSALEFGIPLHGA